SGSRSQALGGQTVIGNAGQPVVGVIVIAHVGAVGIGRYEGLHITGGIVGVIQRAFGRELGDQAIVIVIVIRGCAAGIAHGRSLARWRVGEADRRLPQ